MVQQKTRIFQQKNVFDSSLTNCDHIQSKGLSEVYSHEKKHRNMDKTSKKCYNEVGTFFQIHQKCNQEPEKTIS